MATVSEILAQNAASNRLKQQQALLAEPTARSTSTTPNLGSQQVVPQAGVNLNASNPIQLLSQSISGAANSLTAGDRRVAEQNNLDATAALKAEALNYDRTRQAGLDTQAQQLNTARIGNQDAQTSSAYFDQNLARIAADDKTAVDGALASLNFSRPIDDAKSFGELTTIANSSDLTDSQKEQFITNGLERLGTQQGLVDTSTPDSSFSQLKDDDGKVIGSFDNKTGQRSLYELGADDSINNDTGKPNSWSKTQVESSGAASGNYQVASDAINSINGITVDDISNITGITSLGGAITPENRSSQAKFNQLLGQEFLGNVQQLKGLGSLSNAEGSKVTAAANALVDPETNTLRTGLTEEHVQTQLQAVKSGYENMQRIAEFTEKNGREPNIGEYREITPALGNDGNTIQFGNAVVTEADIYQTMKDNNLTRVQVLARLQGSNQ